MHTRANIREIRPEEYHLLGQLMIAVYADLDGFPTPDEQPDYYKMLANIGAMNEQRATTVLAAFSEAGRLMGGVVYFSDMAMYGSGGTATTEKNASGIRLLGVDPKFRKAGVGRAPTVACIQRAKDDGNEKVILHTTMAMQVAWKLYENMGFRRSEDLDFLQGELPVYGFRLYL